MAFISPLVISPAMMVPADDIACGQDLESNIYPFVAATYKVAPTALRAQSPEKPPALPPRR